MKHCSKCDSEVLSNSLGTYYCSLHGVLEANEVYDDENSMIYESHGRKFNRTCFQCTENKVKWEKLNTIPSIEINLVKVRFAWKLRRYIKRVGNFTILLIIVAQYYALFDIWVKVQ